MQTTSETAGAVKPLTLQQVFDNALNGIRRQDYVPAQAPSSSCTYLTDNGNRCAIGHSLDDRALAELEEAGFLTAGVSDARQRSPRFKALFCELSEGDLVLLQAFHDGLAYMKLAERRMTFELQMQSYAEGRHLTYTPPAAAVEVVGA